MQSFSTQTQPAIRDGPMSKSTYLITGATSGIGFCLSQQLAMSGKKVLALGRNSSKLAELDGLSENIFPVAFDVSRIDKIAGFMSQVFKDHPDINVLINNAGIQDNVRVDDSDYNAENIKNEITINLTAPIELSRAALPFLSNAANGRIVNVTSGLAFVPKTTSAVYSATKSGLHLFSEGLRVQSGDKLSVSEVILPIVATPMTEGRGSGKISADDAARQIITGIAAQKDRIYVGKAKALPYLLRIAPFIARRIIQKS